jgi:hypothetical protein
MHNVSHRILTEDIDRPLIVDILTKYFDSFTIVPQVGYFQGKEEKSLSIELIGASERDVLRASEEIRIANSQEAIIVFSVNGKSRLLIA